MKKLLSMVLAMALILTMGIIPTFASEGTVEVDITSISQKDIFAVGADINLSVNAEKLDNVSHIDFYANGDKIPGMVVGNSGSIFWYNVKAGYYEISTKVTFVGDTVSEGSEKVCISVQDLGNTNTLLYSAEDISKWTVKNFGDSEIALSEDYAVYGEKTLKVIPYAGGKILGENLELSLDEHYQPFAMIVYSASDSTYKVRVTYTYLRDGYTETTQQYTKDAEMGLKKGFNVFGNTFHKPSVLKSIEIEFSGNDANGSGEPVYICGITAQTAGGYGTIRAVATPVIENGATGICNALQTYRIEYDRGVYVYDKNAVKIKDASGTEVANAKYIYGNDYIDIDLSKCTLTQGATYTISKGNAVSWNNGYVDSPDEYTFTTKDTECDSATPVVKMSYPEADAKIGGNSGFAAKIIAPSSAIKSVKFYDTDGTTEIGTAKEGTDGEFWVTPDAALSVGDHTITAKFLNADGGEVVSASVNVTVMDALSYYIKGIQNNDYIVAQEEAKRTVTVVDLANKDMGSSNATGITKVEFINNGELIDTVSKAPYSCDVVFDKFGENTLLVKVYDILGGVTPFDYKYNVLNGVKETTYSFDEDFSKTTTLEAKVGSLGTKQTAEIKDEALYVTSGQANKDFMIGKEVGRNPAGEGLTTNTAAKVLYYSFELYFTVKDNKIVGLFTRKDSKVLNLISYSGATENSGAYTAIKSSQKNKMELVFDFNKGEVIVRNNNLEITRVDASSLDISQGVWPQIKISGTANIRLDDMHLAMYDLNTTAEFGVDSTVQQAEYTNLSGDVATITTKAINTSEQDENLVNIIAVYNGNQLLKVAQIDEVDYDAGYYKSQTYSVPLVHNGVQGNKIRVFTWNSLGGLTPVDNWGE